MLEEYDRRDKARKVSKHTWPCCSDENCLAEPVHVSDQMCPVQGPRYSLESQGTQIKQAKPK